MAEREYVLFCDESDKDGPHYCNFYGGLIVGGSMYQAVSERLDAVKARENLHNEVKWQRVTGPYLNKYKALMSAFFDELEAGHVKVRIMFRQAAREPEGLTAEQIGSSYYRLYYQFIKHAFGLRHLPHREEGTRLRLYFDQFPDTGQQVTDFKGFIKRLERVPGFRRANIRIREEDITEVRSHEHVLLQCLDVVLGAMQFRLNDKHLVKAPGRRTRGKRTIAKEKLYKAIRSEVCEVNQMPHFNIGITTGKQHGLESLWRDRYRHWAFLPRQHRYEKQKTKGWQRKNPA